MSKELVIVMLLVLGFLSISYITIYFACSIGSETLKEIKALRLSIQDMASNIEALSRRLDNNYLRRY